MVIPAVNAPSVAFKPTVYSASPAANPEPLFFGNFGRNYLNNNIGGKVGLQHDTRIINVSCSVHFFTIPHFLLKAEYGNYAGRRPYPSYGDYYRTHRYPINDGWMLWDEDLRDLDSKSDKIGSGKDGGR